MSTQSGSAVVTGIIDAFNAGNLDGIRGLVTPNVVYQETGTGRRVEGVDTYLEMCRGWRQAFPDVAGVINSTLETGNQVAVEVTWTGTHDGPLPLPQGEVSPTGKAFTVEASFWCTLEGERVADVRHYLDVLSMLQQIGVMS
jgi:steroid delta-isomerase-like uncharacterized protein